MKLQGSIFPDANIKEFKQCYLLVVHSAIQRDHMREYKTKYNIGTKTGHKFSAPFICVLRQFYLSIHVTAFEVSIVIKPQTGKYPKYSKTRKCQVCSKL